LQVEVIPSGYNAGDFVRQCLAEPADHRYSGGNYMKSTIICMVLVIGIFAIVATGQRGGNAVVKSPAALKDKAPETFKADFELNTGKHFVIEVHRAWSPNGADRFYNLVKNGLYDDCRFFRVVPGFMVQFGINGDPAVRPHGAMHG
jgi:peptidyl-prolyl cis-trans isomerase A (cyclophilin A)